MHSVELPLQTPLDFDQMQPLPPPKDTDKKNNGNFNLLELADVDLTDKVTSVNIT